MSVCTPAMTRAATSSTCPRRAASPSAGHPAAAGQLGKPRVPLELPRSDVERPRNEDLALRVVELGQRLRLVEGLQVDPLHRVEAGDPVHAWFHRVLDLYDGLARRNPGYDW